MISNVNRRMVCACSLLCLRAFLVLEDTSSDQMLPCSLIIQYHWHISITGKSNSMRCMAHGGLWCDTCKHPVTCPRWMPGCLQERWSSDRTKPQLCFWALPWAVRDLSCVHWSWSFIYEFYLTALFPLVKSHWIASDRGNFLPCMQNLASPVVHLVLAAPWKIYISAVCNPVTYFG